MENQGRVWENEFMPFGDKSMTKGEFYEENRGLVYKLAGKGTGSCYEKYFVNVQNGFFGFMKAVEAFDETKKHAFSTYAWMKISREIERQNKIASLDLPFRVPIHVFESEKWREKFKNYYKGSISLDYHPKKQDGEQILDFADLGNYFTEEDICNAVDYFYLNKAIDTLEDRASKILKLKLQNLTLKEIGSICGVSAERVRQIILVTNKELKKILAPIMPDRVARGSQL